MGLDSQKFFRQVVGGAPAVNTGEFNRTLGQTIICGSECELPTAYMTVNGEIPLTNNPLQHRSGFLFYLMR